ncbi:MAG: HAMP domain-containing sensor histidine kinase [Bacteroidota bacterium]
MRDQGIGISEADQKRLFERFYRVESQATKHTTGFGIGLYLVAEILRYHHTKIEVDSAAGKGSTFYFVLPIVSH